MITFTSPSADTPLSGRVEVTCSTEDESALTRYVLYIEDVERYASTEGCTFSWNTEALPNGTYSVRAEVTDEEGNVGEETASFSIDNPTLRANVSGLCIYDFNETDADGTPWDEDGGPDLILELKAGPGDPLLTFGEVLWDASPSRLPICRTYFSGAGVEDLDQGLRLVLRDEDGGARQLMGRTPVLTLRELLWDGRPSEVRRTGDNGVDVSFFVVWE